MTFAQLHASATSILQQWQPTDLGQRSLREAYLSYLAARSDAMQRECAPGHLTASTVVIDAAGRATLLTLHPRIGRWVQLGGHCESSDSSLIEAALREAREESGIDNLSVSAEPIHLEVHPLTCSGGVPTRHLDVRFLVRAPHGAQPQISEESLDLRWFDFDALPDDMDDSTRAMLLHIARLV